MHHGQRLRKQKPKKNANRGDFKVCLNSGICNKHHWLKGWTPLTKPILRPMTPLIHSSVDVPNHPYIQVTKSYNGSHINTELNKVLQRFILFRSFRFCSHNATENNTTGANAVASQNIRSFFRPSFPIPSFLFLSFRSLCPSALPSVMTLTNGCIPGHR